MTELFAVDPLTNLGQYLLIGLVNGSLYALIALGYTMVYGIIELINFAHGDLFMLGSFLALTIVLNAPVLGGNSGAIALCLIACPLFCAVINVAVDRIVYKPLRSAPKLAPLVSAIGVSFVFMNIGLFWYGPKDNYLPNIIPSTNLLADRQPTSTEVAGSVADDGLRITYKDLMVIAVTVPTMIGLSLFVKYSRLGKAMRAVAQNPTAAKLMGINVDRVIAVTFAAGGLLAGVASVVYGLYNNIVGFQMGFTNGLYAFTAAVLGGIGNITGAVLGGLVIGVVRSLGSGYVDEKWTEAIVFLILIIILIFRPNGLLGARIREKV